MISKVINEGYISEHGVRNPRVKYQVQNEMSEESRTIQSYRDATDINNIVAHFHRTGEFPFTAVSRQVPQYADVSEISHKNPQELSDLYDETIQRLNETEAQLAEQKAIESEPPPQQPLPDQPEGA